MDTETSNGAVNSILSLVRIVLTTSGPVALLAMGLVVFQGYYVWERLGQIQSNQVVILKQMYEASKMMSNYATLQTEQNHERIDQLRVQTRILHRICVSVADTQSAKNIAACWGDE